MRLPRTVALPLPVAAVRDHQVGGGGDAGRRRVVGGGPVEWERRPVETGGAAAVGAAAPEQGEGVLNRDVSGEARMPQGR